MFDRVASICARLAPWAIIGGLAYAAVFVKVDVEAEPMPQPLVEQRDQFFGATATTTALWFVGQGGSVLSRDATSQRWQRSRLEPTTNLQAIAASDAGVLVAVGNDGRVWSRSGEGAWASQRLPIDEVGSKLLDVAFFSGHFWVVGEMGALFRAGADAQQWTRLREPDDVGFNRVRPGPDGSVWIAAEFGRLLHSRDGGETWESRELGSESLQSLAFDGRNGLVVGNRGEAFRSDDGGDTWQAAGTADDEHLYDVIAVDGGWNVAGDRGALFAVDAEAAHWQALTPEGLGKGYHARLLATSQGVVLVGRDLGLLGGDGLYHAWPGTQPAAASITGGSP